MVPKLTLLFLFAATLAFGQYTTRNQRFVVPENSLTGTAAAVTYNGMTGSFDTVTGNLNLYGGLGGGGSLTNATGPGLSVSNSAAILSTNGWVFGKPLGVSGGILTLDPGATDLIGLSTNDLRLSVAALTNGYIFGVTLTAGTGITIDGAIKSFLISVNPEYVVTTGADVNRLTSTNGNGFVLSSPGTGEAVRVSSTVPFPSTFSNVTVNGSTTVNGTATFNNDATFAGNHTVTVNGDLTVNGVTTYSMVENIYSGYVTVVTGTNYVHQTVYSTNQVYEVTIKELGTNVLTVVGGWVFNNSYLNGTNASYISTPHFTDTKGGNLVGSGTWDFTGATLLGVSTGGDALSTNNVRGIVSSIAITNNGVSINGQSIANGSSLTITSGDGLTSNDVRSIVNATNATVQTSLGGKLATNGVAVSSVYATNAGTATLATYATSAGYATNTTLAGDVTGANTATTVGKLQGKTVAATAPGDGDILRYTGGSWTPAAVSNLTSSLGLTNVEYSWQVPAGWLFGAATNTVSVIGQGEYLQLNSAASTIDLRFIKPIGFQGSNVSLSVWMPTTSQATQTVSLSVCVNQPYPQNFLASTNLTFTGSGVATNRVTQSIAWDGLRTNGVAGDTLWFRLTGSANSTNWPEVLRVW